MIRKEISFEAVPIKQCCWSYMLEMYVEFVDICKPVYD